MSAEICVFGAGGGKYVSNHGVFILIEKDKIRIFIYVFTHLFIQHVLAACYTSNIGPGQGWGSGLDQDPDFKEWLACGERAVKIQVMLLASFKEITSIMFC